MTDAQLIKFCREFRKGVLGKRNSEMMCFAVVLPLATLLDMHGIRSMIMESDLGTTNHIWLQLDDGRCLDPTADQFNNERDGRNMPDVYLGQVPVWYRMDYWEYSKRSDLKSGGGETS